MGKKSAKLIAIGEQGGPIAFVAPGKKKIFKIDWGLLGDKIKAGLGLVFVMSAGYVLGLGDMSPVIYLPIAGLMFLVGFLRGGEGE